MSEVLELPRLVLNIGAMGNRKFGKNNGIDTGSKQLEDRAAATCESLLRTIAEIVQRIYGHDREAKFNYVTNTPWHLFQGIAFGLQFGSIDRWKRFRRQRSTAQRRTSGSARMVWQRARRVKLTSSGNLKTSPFAATTSVPAGFWDFMSKPGAVR